MSQARVLHGGEEIIRRFRAAGTEPRVSYETVFCPVCCGAGERCPHCTNGLVEVMVIEEDER